MHRPFCWGLLLVTSLPVCLPAQDYDNEQVDELGIGYLVHRKLKRVPLKLGSAPSNLRARYQPYSVGDYIRGTFRWGLNVYEFRDTSNRPKTGAKKGEEGKLAPETEARLKRIVGSARKGPDTFEEYVKANKFTIVVEGKAYKRKKPPYRWWEYKSRSSQVTYYMFAAAYDLGDREVALVATFPALKKGKADPKHASWARKMLKSVKLLKESQHQGRAASKEEKLAKYADTPARKKALDAAKENIKNLDNWDIFTTPRYIVLYSHPPQKRGLKGRYYRDAKDIAGDMDHMRELYKEYYPPAEGAVFPYSVLRICSTRTEFHKYGGTGGGVAGWFSPRSKELVLFNNDRIMKTVAFHEGWHQYSDTYFGGARLHRWFDEGIGDYFGSFRRSGKKWRYGVNDMRKNVIKAIVSSETYVPLNDIVTWNKSKFYSGAAHKYYAQGYSMVDFFRRGSTKRRLWDPAWDGILDSYRKAMLDSGNQEEAVQATFGQVDWPKLTKAWVAWVKGY